MLVPDVEFDAPWTNAGAAWALPAKARDAKIARTRAQRRDRRATGMASPPPARPVERPCLTKCVLHAVWCFIDGRILTAPNALAQAPSLSDHRLGARRPPLAWPTRRLPTPVAAATPAGSSSSAWGPAASSEAHRPRSPWARPPRSGSRTEPRGRRSSPAGWPSRRADRRGAVAGPYASGVKNSAQADSGSLARLGLRGLAVEDGPLPDLV